MVEKLIEFLPEDALEEFRKSCFGVFLQIPEIMFQKNLFYYLLRRLVPTSDGVKIMKFNINGVDAYFGPDQYIAITGLSFLGEPDNMPESSLLHASVFESKDKIMLKDVEDAFRSSCYKKNDKEKKALKLALVYFTYATLMGRGFTNKPLDLKYLHLADDLEVFNAFPWGRVSYDYFFRQFYNCYLRVRKSLSKGKKPNVELFGFSASLQIWAYEVFPNLGEICAIARRNRFERIYPRMLRWRANEHYTYEIITRSVQERGALAMVSPI